MPIRFLMTDYAHSWVEDQLYVWCTTDIASHLFLRWTAVDMKVHIHEKRIRGLDLMGDPKYCFVEWIEVEQNEVGDSLTHTFNFSGWAAGECRWWHFRAEVDGQPLESNTGIITACYGEQENALSLSHTNLVNKSVDGVIDHDDATITPDKLVHPFSFLQFPLTPEEEPDADYEVANKKYVDDNAGGFSRYSRHRPGRYYYPTGGRDVGTTAVVPNVLMLFPFVTGESFTIDAMSIWVTVINGSGARTYIYADNGNGYPGALFGGPYALNTLVLGRRDAAAAITLPPGLYWIGIASGGNPTLRSTDCYPDTVYGGDGSLAWGNSGPRQTGIVLLAPPDPFPDPPTSDFGVGPTVALRAA